ncbi:MAG: hypothetical protein GX929_05215 [Clostridiales bacterium]|nr:hypothetical protein [Clostridiales bacterium]
MRKYAYHGRPITFTVEVYPDVIPCLGGITMKQFYLDADAAVQAWRKQLAFVPETFGDAIPPREPTAAPLSYGHLVCLGCPLRYPEDAEPNVSPAVSSLDDAIALLKDARGMDFSKTAIWKHYAAMSDTIRAAFPQAPKFAGLGMEGPLTSAALLRGQDFYLDLLDEPEKCAEYLSLMTGSIVEYLKQTRRVNGQPEYSAGGVGLCDDLASMVPPSMWDTHVVPFWRQYYRSLTSSKNWSVHCEALYPAHLPYLRKAGIIRYQPSVSPRLTLENVRANTDIPFDWLLYAYRITDMTDAEIAAWQDETLAAGVTSLRTQFGRFAIEAGKLDRISAWVSAAERYRVSD